MAAPDPTVFVGSWKDGELGRWIADAVTDYRGTPRHVRWRDSEVYRAFVLAIETYDAGAPFPPLHPELAQWFLSYLRQTGA